MMSRCMRAFGKVLEQLTTFFYHEQFKRITLQPMTEIIQHEQEPELQQRMLRQWARTKIREASYIQLAVSVSPVLTSSSLDGRSNVRCHVLGVFSPGMSTGRCTDFCSGQT